MCSPLTCGDTRILLKSEVQSANATFGSSSPLTGMIGFQDFSQSGDMSMPPVKLSVELTFQEGQKTVYSAETPGISPRAPEETPEGTMGGAPYRLAGATGPEGPTLVSSTRFVQVG